MGIRYSSGSTEKLIMENQDEPLYIPLWIYAKCLKSWLVSFTSNIAINYLLDPTLLYQTSTLKKNDSFVMKVLTLSFSGMTAENCRFMIAEKDIGQFWKLNEKKKERKKIGKEKKGLHCLSLHAFRYLVLVRLLRWDHRSRQKPCKPS